MLDKISAHLASGISHLNLDLRSTRVPPTTLLDADLGMFDIGVGP